LLKSNIFRPAATAKFTEPYCCFIRLAGGELNKTLSFSNAREIVNQFQPGKSYHQYEFQITDAFFNESGSDRWVKENT
jgi:hypothetical protein